MGHSFPRTSPVAGVFSSTWAMEGRLRLRFLDDWRCEDVELTIMEGTVPKYGMEVWMGDFTHVNVELGPGSVASVSEDFCAICIENLWDGNSWPDRLRGDVNRSLYSSTSLGDSQTINFGLG